MTPPWAGSGAAAEATDLTAEDDVVSLDCGICFLPLHELPLLQCAGGHVICKPCQDMLGVAPDRCHVCSGKAAVRGSRRGHGRDVWPSYYDRRAREGAARGPCRCPARGCGFLGPTAALLCHVTGAHGWPCVTGVCPGDRVAMRLQAGINVDVVDRGSDGATAGRYLVVMQLTPEPFGWTVVAFCLRPRAADFEVPLFWAPDTTWWQISLTTVRNVFRGRGDDGCSDDDDDGSNDDDGCSDKEGCEDDLIKHYEETTNADVVCTNLCGGRPELEECFEAHLFRSVDAAGDEDGIDVIVSIIIQ